MLWTMPLAFPLMAAIQSICARVGRVTGKGLAANIKTAFPPVVLRAVVLLLLIANTLNIAADVAAMGEVGELVSGVNRHLMTAAFVLVTLALQIFVPYHRYVYFLKWLTLSLLAYAARAVHRARPWGEVALRTVWPQFTPNANAATVVVGVFGTTISPYLFFWQASEEVEDMRARASAAAAATMPPRRRRNSAGSTGTPGAACSIPTSPPISSCWRPRSRSMSPGVTDINTAAKAASALRPLAGDFAYLLFALGILGVGLIGVPVLAGSGAYALCRGDGLELGSGAKGERRARVLWRHRRQHAGRRSLIQYSPIRPMKALFWSAVINGVVAVPLMAVVITLASRPSVMGPFTATRVEATLAWIATAVMAIAAVAMFMPG